jgi:hypothetical protein
MSGHVSAREMLLTEVSPTATGPGLRTIRGRWSSSQIFTTDEALIEGRPTTRPDRRKDLLKAACKVVCLIQAPPFHPFMLSDCWLPAVLRVAPRRHVEIDLQCAALTKQPLDPIRILEAKEDYHGNCSDREKATKREYRLVDQVRVGESPRLMITAIVPGPVVSGNLSG